MKIIVTAVISAMLFVSNFAFAKELPVGTGSASGNYYSMANDIVEFCGSELSSDITLNVLESGGSSENLNGILNKQFALGIVQTDVLYYFNKRMPNKVSSNTIKAVAGLHDEQLHVLIPRGWSPKEEKGFFASMFSSDEQVKLSIDSLKNQAVGAWGGSIISAKALSAAMGLNLNVVEIESNQASKSNIPLVIVGGTPYAPVEQLIASNNWKLVGLDYREISARAPYYKDATLNYTINGKLQAIPSVSVQALLVGKSFRKESRNRPMTEIATCITAMIPDLADDYSTNANWGSVYDFFEAGGQTSWPMFDLDEEMLETLSN